MYNYKRKTLARFCPEPSQLALRNSFMPQNDLERLP